jgi:PBSX family phage terminase large subunit
VTQTKTWARANPKPPKGSTQEEMSDAAVMNGIIEGAINDAHKISNIEIAGLELRGNNLAIQSMDDPEIVLVGAAGTGKSVSNLYKLHRLALENPGLRGLIVRKTRADLWQSTLVSYERMILGEDNPICSGVKREYRRSYRYPNGSEIAVAGMNKPGQALSAEYDIIVAAETVQFELSDWELLMSRLRSGIIKYAQIIGDTNPDKPTHWLKQRGDSGTLKLLPTFHKDNPAYWSLELNDWTDAGRRYVLGMLHNLTGVRRRYYLLGEWALSEGMVYEGFDNNIHVINPFSIPNTWRRIRSIDFGFTNPFSCSWWAIDRDDRMYCYRQIYYTQRRVDEHAEKINQLTGEERIEVTVADHDAEGRATLLNYGIATVPAYKKISDGIQEVQRRLLTTPDAQGVLKPSIAWFNDALVEIDPLLEKRKAPLWTVDEIYGYTWHKDQNGKANKEIPVDEDNHGCDETRYAAAYLKKGIGDGAGTMLQVPVRQYAPRAPNKFQAIKPRKPLKLYKAEKF